ncbi:Hemicentin-1 [Chionoecetes opilio]|uniref:Hemicentin-1 n=1 Tax=Chionoecetes opilio TaxID=41210 RepID=A0A8J5D3Z1_CHIOP|nr:Hemicentin-1 [Chionoecetes opilio]
MAPSVSWTRDGSAIGINGKGNINTEGNGRWLRVVRAGSHNAGLYTCTATNLAGLLDVDLSLNVHVVPEVVRGRLSGVKHSVLEGGKAVEVVIVTEGGHAVLECYLLKGSPAPSRLWTLMPNMSLPQHFKVMDGGERVAISQASVEDTGTYNCLARNVAGQDNKLVKLQVYASPRVNMSALPSHFVVLHKGKGGIGVPSKGLPGNSSHSVALTTTHGQTVTLPCPVTGYPLPRRLWYQGSRALVSSAKQVIGAGGRDLTLVGVEPGNAGLYVCVAVNPAGETQLTTALHVIFAPDIQSVGRPSRQYNVSVGEAVELECDAQGNPPPQVIWSHQDAPLKPSSRLQMLKEGHVLSISEVEVNDDGNYTCKAVNVVGTTDETFHLHVYAPPKVSGPLETTVSVLSGQPVKLECDIEGRPKPAFTWTLNGNDLDSSDIIVEDNLLNIESTELGHAGTYQCEAVNSVGQAVKTFKLHVQEPPIIAGGLEEVVTVVEGEAASLHCLASGTGGAGSWAHEHLHVSHEGSNLQIHYVEKSDAGFYSCLASNVAGNATKQYLLQVLVKPALLAAEDEVKVVAGQRTTLSCSFSGFPQPQVLRGDPVADVPASGALQLSPVLPNNFGNYTCVADNEAGQANHTIHLTVHTPPSVHVEKKQVVAVSGAEVTLHCRAEGFPVPTIRWFKAHKVITPSPEFEVRDDGSLHVPLVLPSLADTYVCTGQNPAGSASDHTQLVVQEPPVVMSDQQTEVTVTQGQEASLICDVTGSPPPTITWARPDMGHTPVTPEDPRIKDLFAAPPSVKEERNESVSLKRGEELRLGCTVSGSPQPRTAWLRDGRVLYNTARILIQPNGDLVVSTTQVCLHSLTLRLSF